MATKSDRTNKAAQNRKSIVIARLRGGSLEDCGRTCGVTKQFADKVIKAFILQVDSGMVADMPDGVDPVLRWQIARADKNELEVLKMRGDLKPVEVVRQQCAKIAEQMRSVQIRLDKQFGVDAGNLVRDALASMARAEKELIEG